ncbi:MAG: hypothetical protein AAFQ16_07450 [Pseudomonadota bacterium]
MMATLDELGIETVRDAIHKLNNYLNTISMQSEVAKVFVDQGAVDEAQDALDVVRRECQIATLLSRFLSEHTVAR